MGGKFNLRMRMQKTISFTHFNFSPYFSKDSLTNFLEALSEQWRVRCTTFPSGAL